MCCIHLYKFVIITLHHILCDFLLQLPASDVESSERPPMDLFKAIFENSEPSSSSSEASDDEDKQDKDADSATAAINNTASDIAPAAVSNTAPLSLQHPTQQQDSDGEIISRK